MDTTILTKAQTTLKEIIQKATTDQSFANDLAKAAATCESEPYKSLSRYFMLTVEELTKLGLTDQEQRTWEDLRTRTPTITHVAMLAQLKDIAVEEVQEVARALRATTTGRAGGKPSPSPKRRKPKPKSKSSKK